MFHHRDEDELLVRGDQDLHSATTSFLMVGLVALLLLAGGLMIWRQRRMSH